MKVKRYFVSILLITVLNICACGRMGTMSFMNGGGQKIADETFKALIEAVEAEDSETIKGMFAEDALSQIDDIDSEINAFIDFYQGNMESWDDWGGASLMTSSGGGKGYYQQIEGYYKITTSEEKYRMIFLLNQSAPEKSHEGIYEIGIIKEDIYDEKRQEFGSDVPGLYIVE